MDTSYFTGVHGNYLGGSIEKAGINPDELPERDPSTMDFGSSGSAKAWRDIWCSGQGDRRRRRGPLDADYVDQLAAEYEAARARLWGDEVSASPCPR